MPTIAAAEERWRLTIDNAPTGIALVGLAGQFLRVNVALCRMLGHTEEELLAVDFQQLTHPDDLGTDLSYLEQLVAGEIPSYRMHKRYLHADGHHVWADLSVSLVRDSKGQPLHFVSHIADLTDEVKAAAQIEQFNRELSEQKALLELLEARYEDVFDERATEWVTRIGDAAERMSELVNSLLAFSRVGGTQVLEEKVSVIDLVEEVRQDLGELATAGAEIVVDPNSSAVTADRSRLRQVLQNLIQNAVKYRHPDRDPRCEVKVVERDADWLITVTDNALGVAPEHRESIFSMFARVGGQAPGQGIGLAACRQIVERHGGAIWVDPVRAGGSRFSFTLPR